jgi:NAD(P)-dependent dehydrogenase (short-subunit alcohol dehydrogenase family)
MMSTGRREQMGRFGKADEMAQVALLSDKASYITGQVIKWMAGWQAKREITPLRGLGRRRTSSSS